MMLKKSKNIWLLFLPLFILISLLLQDAPELTVVGISNNSAFPDREGKFFAAEESLHKLYVMKDNVLLVDAATEKNLSKIDVDIKEILSGELFEKTFPSAQGKKLLRLVSCYQMYKQEEQRLNKLNLSSQTNVFVDYRPLQHKFFGELAQNLFFDHHMFYKSAEASGVKLVSPELNNIIVPVDCNGIHNVE